MVSLHIKTLSTSTACCPGQNVDYFVNNVSLLHGNSYLFNFVLSSIEIEINSGDERIRCDFLDKARHLVIDAYKSMEEASLVALSDAFPSLTEPSLENINPHVCI